jgi:CheY-like chemotaxis protein
MHLPTHNPANWKNANILIADNHPVRSSTFASWCRSFGASVSVANDASEAARGLRQNTVDLFIFDIRLPRCNAFEMATEAKRANLRTNILLVHAGCLDVEIADAYESGIEAIVRIPCTRSAFLASVERCLIPKSQLWAMPPAGQPAFILSRQYQYSQTIAGGLKWGRGGFFLPECVPPVLLDEPIAFNFRFGWTGTLQLQGNGILRWSRSTGYSRLRAGCGIEICHLSDLSRDIVITALDGLATNAYIPKGYSIEDDESDMKVPALQGSGSFTPEQRNNLRD